MTTPYIGFGNDQLEAAPKLPEKAPCFKCGKLCKVKDSTPPELQFISCCGQTWLVGVRGKLVEHLRLAVKGEI